MTDILQRFDDMAPKSFQPGDLLMQEGHETGKLFVLKSGSVEVRRAGRVVTTVSAPGAVLGEMSALLDRPHTATVVAITPVEAYGLDEGIRFLEARPALALHVAVLLAQRLDTTTTLLQSLQAGPAAAHREVGLFERLLGFLTGQPGRGKPEAAPER